VTTTVRIDREALAERLASAVTPEEVTEALFVSLDGTARGLYLFDQEGDLYLEDRCPHDAAAARSFVEAEVPSRAVRFSFRDRPLGAVLFHRVPDDPALPSILQTQFSPAIFRSLYLDDVLSDNDRMREQLFYLDEMGKLIGQLDLDMLLVNILELTSAHLGSDIGSITLLHHDELVTAVDWGLPHDALMALQRADGRRVIDEIMTSREPVLLAREDLRSDHQGQYNFDRLLMLPLCTNDALWGCINLVAPQHVTAVESPLLASVRSGVGLAATAVENALLIEMKLSREREQEQLKVGHQIQSQLLPSEPPDRPGLEIDGSSVSATMIGGDYFDYFDLPDGRLGLVVADVSGKGVPAGLIMTATRALFRATATRHSDPAAILGEVNRLLCAEGFGARFVTAVFAALDPRTGTVGYSTAGHDAPSIRRADTGRIDSFPLPALPLGLRPGASYEAQTFRLAIDDTMVLYTDGVSEAMDHSREQFGADRLHRVLAHSRGLGASDLRDRILAAIDEHCGTTPRHDDTTLIVVRRTPDVDDSDSRSGERDRERTDA